MRRARLLLTLSLLAAPARAEPVPGGEVAVERTPQAEACPAEHELVAAALALGAAPEGRATAPLSIRVRFAADATGLAASVTSAGPKVGERELHTAGPDCAKLAESVAVVLAVLLDIVPPEAIAAFEAEVPVASSSRADASPPPRASAHPAAPAASPRADAAGPSGPPFELRLRGEGALAFGILGGIASAELGGTLALSRGRAELSLGGLWVVPRRVPFEPIAGTGVDVSLGFGQLRGCLRLSPEAGGVESSVCAQLAAGVLTGEGQGFDHPSTSHELFLGAGPAFSLRLRLVPRLSLWASGGGLVTLGRRVFEVSGYGEAFHTPILHGAVTLGPELQIF